MRNLCIAGKNNIAVNVIKNAASFVDKERLFCITDASDIGKDGWQRSLKRYCNSVGIKIITLEEAYDIDNMTFISTEFDRIIRIEKFKKTTDFYNIHFSLLPKYKGMFTSILPILNDESETGVTLHIMNNGIDTGDIIEQRKIPIPYDYNSLELYNDLISVGSEVVISNLKRLLCQDYVSCPQSIYNSSYHSKDYIDYKNIDIDTNATANQIHNKIRAFAFRPYQLASINGINIVGSDVLEEASVKKSGTIVYEDNVIIIMATIDYNIKLYKDVLEDAIEALKNHDDNKVKRLCEYKKIMNEQDNRGWSLLFYALNYENYGMLKYFIDSDANVNQCDYEGKTLLMYAMKLGGERNNWDYLDILLKHANNINAVDYDFRTVVDYIDDLESVPKYLRTSLGR